LGSEENYFWKTAKERKERLPFEPENEVSIDIEPELG